MNATTELRAPPGERVFSAHDLNGLSELLAAELRESFFHYRCHMRPDMLQNWWTYEVAQALQQFYEDLIAGHRPRLAIGAPPQHGKSLAAEDFIAWVSGNNPNLKTIFASYSADLGIRTNLALQRTFVHPTYREIFPRLQAGSHGWVMNTELIEFPGFTGSFRNTTIEGAINGMSLDLGVIDDPIKGRAEASSKVTRERVWNWFTDDWGSRFSKDAGMLVIMTRWHVDDLLGRFIDKAKGDIRVINYPAVAETREMYRRPGMALFPELKPLEFLQERRKLLTESSWQSLYQQHPIVVGGGIFPIEKIMTIPMLDRSQIMKSVRYVDKAGEKAQLIDDRLKVLAQDLRQIEGDIINCRSPRWRESNVIPLKTKNHKRGRPPLGGQAMSPGRAAAASPRSSVSAMM
jgi:hypothetical protein